MKGTKKENIKFGIIALVALLFIVAMAYFFRLLKKKANANNLQVAGFDFELLEPIQLKHLTQPIKAKLKLNLGNYSTSNFKIEQVAVSLLSPSGSVVAQPLKPMTTPINLDANKINTLPVEVQISTTNLFKLLKENGFLSADSITALQSLIKGGMPKFNATVKGFIQAEGAKININETLTNNAQG